MGTDTPTYTLENIIYTAIAQHKAVAVWRLPLEQQVQACVSLQQNYITSQPDLENSHHGFLFSPFMVSEEQPAIFIKADIAYSSESGQLQVSKEVTPAQQQEFILALANNQSRTWHTGALQQHTQQTESGFKHAVSEAIKNINAGAMEKVVLSRTATYNLSSAFDLITAFSTMLYAYPRAFVSLVSVPGAGTWLGASPEILVSVDQEQIFRTVALAGTQPANGDTDMANAIWRQKEIEEQGMVERYILSCFKKLRLREYTEVGPRTIVAGNLMHLRTDFKVDLKEVSFPTLGTDMLHLLHPTSAICGLPKEPALEFIKQHEGYDRSYYSGYLGPVNSPAGTHLFVNLRCMQLLADKVVLYAGAGITAESSAEKEYQETEHKMETMRQVLDVFS